MSLNLKSRFANLGDKFYARVSPTPLKNPHLIHFNHEVAQQISLDEQSLDWVSVLGGHKVIDNYHPLAALYAGHQFGAWVPRLGDGRAMLIAEHQDIGENIWELQTKGGGETPFSRNADGRAVLRSSIREYLCSHAMHKLGVPTTFAMALIGAETKVYREQVETAAIVLRVAPSFIRFGSFEVFANHGAELEQLSQYMLDNFFPQFKTADKPLLSMYEEIIRRTAAMIAKWQGLGFCHGVMNTDNMSILGLTLDYGPFGFMDNYDPKHICNHSDYSGRYAYANQPYIGWWNLARLGESLLSLLSETEVRDTLGKYSEYFTSYYLHEFGNKLGIPDLNKADLALLEELLAILAVNKIDWTIFWRQFSYGANDKLPSSLITDAKYINWLLKYNQRRINLNLAECQVLMLNSNPAVVARNYLLQRAIEKAQVGDFSELDNLYRALSTPYEDKPEFAHYQDYPPLEAAEISVSCSS